MLYECVCVMCECECEHVAIYNQLIQIFKKTITSSLKETDVAFIVKSM